MDDVFFPLLTKNHIRVSPDLPVIYIAEYILR